MQTCIVFSNFSFVIIVIFYFRPSAFVATSPKHAYSLPHISYMTLLLFSLLRRRRDAGPSNGLGSCSEHVAPPVPRRFVFLFYLSVYQIYLSLSVSLAKRCQNKGGGRHMAKKNIFVLYAFLVKSSHLLLLMLGKISGREKLFVE